jgi:hypothetical protein
MRDGRRLLELARELHRAAHEDPRLLDIPILKAMTAEMVKSAERILAREIPLTLIVRKDRVEGR